MNNISPTLHYKEIESPEKMIGQSGHIECKYIKECGDAVQKKGEKLAVNQKKIQNLLSEIRIFFQQFSTKTNKNDYETDWFFLDAEKKYYTHVYWFIDIKNMIETGAEKSAGTEKSISPLLARTQPDIQLLLKFEKFKNEQEKLKKSLKKLRSHFQKLFNEKVNSKLNIPILTIEELIEKKSESIDAQSKNIKEFINGLKLYEINELDATLEQIWNTTCLNVSIAHQFNLLKLKLSLLNFPPVKIKKLYSFALDWLKICSEAQCNFIVSYERMLYKLTIEPELDNTAQLIPFFTRYHEYLESIKSYGFENKDLIEKYIVLYKENY